MQIAKPFGVVVVVALAGACSLGSDFGDTSTPTGGVDSGSAPANPPGTVTTDLRTMGNGPDSLNFGAGSVTTATVNGAEVVCLYGGATDLGLDSALNFQACSGTIVGLGPMGGLSDIAAAPTAGFLASAAAKIGEGYVVKTAEGNLYRVFVVRGLIGAQNGGVIGLEIAWAALGEECAGTLTRCNGLCVDTRSDINNCGGCGMVCPGADAGAGCGPYSSTGNGACTLPVRTK